jgi:hypothetical protein
MDWRKSIGISLAVTRPARWPPVYQDTAGTRWSVVDFVVALFSLFSRLQQRVGLFAGHAGNSRAG